MAEWMKSNRLALSIFKTNFFLFYSKKLKPYKSLKNHVNDVNELCLKLSKTVGIFSKLRYYVNVDILIMLYYSLIYPFLTYGIQVWGLTYPTYLKPVATLKLQKRVVRIMTFTDPRSHSEPLQNVGATDTSSLPVHNAHTFV